VKIVRGEGMPLYRNPEVFGNLHVKRREKVQVLKDMLAVYGSVRDRAGPVKEE
jgi:hypothetical protein